MDDLRTFFLSASLPPTLTPRPWLEIFDVALFVETNLARLESESPLIRKLAVASLTALKKQLES